VKCEITMRSESLNPEDTWREINISLTEESKEGGSLTFEVAKRKIAIRSGPLDHRGLWTIDLEYFRYRELEESGLAHVQTSETNRDKTG
jgi:hypothetical protein